MTDEELQSKCEEWQKILRLQDWNIKARFAKTYDMSNPSWEGQCDWTLSKKQALIKILDPSDYDPSCIKPQDIDATLVHELLHLHFAAISEGYANNSAEYTSLHQAIECIATGLSFLYNRSIT